jgi:translation elongation factor P/translation initiation factor 5A
MWSLIDMEETTMMKFDARQSEAQWKAIEEEMQAKIDAWQSETWWRVLEEETQAKFDAKMLIKQR